MKEPTPIPPELNSLAHQDALPIKKPTTLEEVADALGTIREVQGHILYILETPAREAAMQKAKDEERNSQMQKKMGGHLSG